MSETGAVLEVEEPGLLATIQDAGRPGLGALGIPAGGAADGHSLRVANALLGNAPGLGALELTLPGARLRVLRAITVAIAGADLGAVVAGTGEPVPPGRTLALREGDELAFAGGPGAAGGRNTGPAGARAYLAVPGGIDVPLVLGSRSTALGAGFGGHEGRALRPGDRLHATGAGLDRPPARWTGPVTDPRAGPLRVLDGPHGAAAILAAVPWRVGPASDRMGLRLAGDALGGGTGSSPSFGVLPGSVQVPPDGSPIVLLVDAQPTGGYPVIAVVAAVDRDRLGQLLPGDEIAFEAIDEAAARRLAAARRDAVDRALAHLHEAATWDALWRGAGG